MKKFFCLLIIFPLIALASFAQTTAAEIETLLNTKAVTYAQAARFVLEASDANITANPAEAFTFALDRNWLGKKAAADTEARLDGIALLVMQSFDMKGGILYSLTKNPRYAYRELVYQSVITGITDPAMTVSGDELLYIVNRVFSGFEEGDAQRRQSDNAKTAEHEALAAEINIQLEELNVAGAHASVTREGVSINLSNIQFLADSAVLTEPEKVRLREIAQILASIPGRRIQVAGHTALSGDDSNSFALSLDRAQAVAVYLVSMGAREPGEVTTVGYGSRRPIADNSTPEGMAANRRVEITIMDN